MIDVRIAQGDQDLCQWHSPPFEDNDAAMFEPLQRYNIFL